MKKTARFAAVAMVAAIALSACGEREDDTANEGSIDLPRGLLEAVSLLESDPALTDALSPDFIGLYAGVKRGEFETFMQVISPWEREFLLLNV